MLDKIETILSPWMIYNDSPTDSLQPWCQHPGGTGEVPWRRMCQESNRGRAIHSRDIQTGTRHG
jgi:hypothetical protein